MKYEYGSVTFKQVEIAINKLGGKEVWDAWIRGEKTVTVEDAIRLFFDKHGRRIPEGLQAKVCDADRDFRLDQPKLDFVDFANRIMRLHWCLSIDTKVTAEQLKAETERLLAIIRENSRIANIANGVYLPVVLPKLVTEDLGSELELYLYGVNNSYAKSFGNRHRKGDLENEVSIVNQSRHDQLIKLMKQWPVIGLHFPSSLQGFSVNASREQMSILPEGFILSGMDTPIAIMMYPDILARDWNVPGLDMAALQWWSADYSLDFGAGGGGAFFGRTGNLANASVRYSSGLLFLG